MRDNEDWGVAKEAEEELVAVEKVLVLVMASVVVSVVSVPAVVRGGDQRG